MDGSCKQCRGPFEVYGSKPLQYYSRGNGPFCCQRCLGEFRRTKKINNVGKDK